jgi:hypothetical protein
MCKEELLKCIRKEEVIFWAGAGFSKYAGYPLGSELKDYIFNNLSKADQVEVGMNLPLDDMAEAFIRFNKGIKQGLFQLLEPAFYKTPVSTTNHDLLSQIPHFRTIITTNYDRMFEQAYGDKSVKIFRDSDVTK